MIFFFDVEAISIGRSSNWFLFHILDNRCILRHDVFNDHTEIQIVIGRGCRQVLLPVPSRTAVINTVTEVLLFCFVLFKPVKLALLQLEEMPRVLVVSFPLFTRERFTGDAQLKMQSRNGVQSLKCLISTESGVTAIGE